MPKELHEVFRCQVGNALGVILEPIHPHRKRVPMSKWEVRIGVADEKLAAILPFPRDDIQRVINRLKEWIENEGISVDSA